MPSPFTINLPKAHAFKVRRQKCTPPTTDFLSEIWHVTHSSLPLWKNKRNVNITYKPLSPSTGSAKGTGVTKLDDLVQYQGTKSDKIKSVHGVDTLSPRSQGAWDWRGTSSGGWQLLLHIGSVSVLQTLILILMTMVGISG